MCAHLPVIIFKMLHKQANLGKISWLKFYIKIWEETVFFIFYSHLTLLVSICLPASCLLQQVLQLNRSASKWFEHYEKWYEYYERPNQLTDYIKSELFKWDCGKLGIPQRINFCAILLWTKSLLNAGWCSQCLCSGVSYHKCIKLDVKY